MCMHLSFACSLRLGEVLGLTWDCVDLSEKSMAQQKPSVLITKTLQRVRKDAIEALNKRDIVKIFPEQDTKGKTVLILKKPKTTSSIRRVFLPMTLAQMLIKWKANQEEKKLLLGDEYTDHNLVVPRPWGTPEEGANIEKAFKNLILDNGLPAVVFHSIRHTSITYKLKLNGGDIKAVQGDSGHSQASMITDRYSHVLEESRVSNAAMMERAFYRKQASEQTADAELKAPVKEPPEIPAQLRELIGMLAENPDAVRLLQCVLDLVKGQMGNMPAAHSATDSK